MATERAILELREATIDGMHCALLDCGHWLLAPWVGLGVKAIPCSVCIITADAGRGAGGGDGR